MLQDSFVYSLSVLKQSFDSFWDVLSFVAGL